MSYYLSTKDDFDIIEKIYELGKDAERQRKKEFVSALTMQRWWRGRMKVLKKKTVAEAAITVGRFLTMIKTKKIMMRCIRKNVQEKHRNYFDGKIVKFQALWRGYASRKNVFWYYQWKRDLKVSHLQM